MNEKKNIKVLKSVYKYLIEKDTSNVHVYVYIDIHICGDKTNIKHII